MNIFIRELRANAKVWLIWALVIVLFNGAGLVKYQGIEAGGSDVVKQLTDAFPKVALAVMGIGDLDMTTFAGYYAVLEFYIGIMAAVYAVALTRNAVSRESVDGTYEFLFTKPRSRSMILSMKLAAAFVCMLLFAVVNLVSSLAFYQTLGEMPNAADDVMVMCRFSGWLLAMMLIFGAIAACAAASCRRAETGAQVGNAAVVVAYCAAVGYDMFGDYDAAVVARVIAPFRYFTPADCIDGTVCAPFAVLGAAVVVAGIGVTYAAFTSRDLAA
jgi:ABC-2 type transport system permease protein